MHVTAKRHDSRSYQWVWALSTVIVIAVVVYIPPWPGVFTVDSQAIYSDAIRGSITNWYSPGITWVWSIAERLNLVPGAVFAGA